MHQRGIDSVLSGQDSGNLLLAARYDNGFWIKMADGLYRNATRRLVPDAADSMWSGKFAKALTGPDALWENVLGHDLEIVPLSDPNKAKPGQTLRLRVLFHGKPLPGAGVERGDGVTAVAEKDTPRFATDADGIASVPVVKAGPHFAGDRLPGDAIGDARSRERGSLQRHVMVQRHNSETMNGRCPMAIGMQKPTTKIGHFEPQARSSKSSSRQRNTGGGICLSG